MNSQQRSLLLAFLAVSVAGTLRADFADHAAADAFAAEVQELAPTVQIELAATDPADCITQGQWSSVINWTPHIPVSAANLPDGRILTFASNQRTTFPSGPEFTYAATWNPSTGQFVEYNHGDHDMFCGGLATLPDGRVLVCGGRNTTVRTSIFDWRTSSWTRVQDMNDPRWYNTALALPDGGVWTVTGSGGYNTSERWSAASGWFRLTGIDWSLVTNEAGYITNWHPFVSVAPDGRLFHFGPTDTMHWVTYAGNGSLTNSGQTVPGSHYPKEGSWVMYDEGKILVAGGGATTTPNASDNTTGTSSTVAYTVNLNTNPPTVASTGSMTYARQFANCTVLPSGEVLVMGGNTSGLKFNDTGSILIPEIWNPKTGLWRTVASMSVPRNYHSVALLLPDGRVWSGGGGLGGNAADHRDAQLYTPPCLFTSTGALATRPTLTAAPTKIGIGSTFSVTGTAGLAKFSFIKMSALTHSVNTDLRSLSLPFVETSAGNYQLTARSNLNVMTPGYWMLFGVDPSGVFSVSKVIQVDSTNSVSLANPGNQTSVSNLPTSLALVANAPAGAVITYSATNLPVGLTINSSTGVISGTPTVIGASNVRLTASAAGTNSSADITWTISPQTFSASYSTFASSSGFTLNGSAAVTSGVLRLTSNSNNQAGSAYLSSPVPVGANTSFTTRFVFRQHGSADGADGLTFLIQGSTAAALGLPGGGLGYDGISRSLALEFDSYGGPGDPDGNHLGVLTNGVTITHLATYTPGFDLENGLSHTAWVEYDGSANTLRVYLAQGIVTTRPASAVITLANIDLPALTGSSAWFGFTGGTGGLANNQDIESWSLLVNASALPTAPSVTNPGSQISAVDAPVSLQMQASDANGDLLTYSATGLPTGLAIDPNSGLIFGTPTDAQIYNVTVSVTDGNTAPTSVSFAWTVNPPLSLQPLSGSAVASGTVVSFSATSVGGVNVRYKWNFGDGTADTALSATSSVSHTFPGPGRYLVTVTAQDDTGRQVTSSFRQAIHAPLTAFRPTASTSILFEDRATGNDRVWCVNPDNDSVTAFDSVTRTKVAEIAVGANPKSLALAPDGRLWVVNAGAASLSIISTSALAVAQTVALPRASHPFGLAFDPDGTDAWIACESTGMLLRLNPATGAQVASLSVGLNVRHVSVSADSSRVFVSRFITPVLPGESTGSVQTTVSGANYGGEIVTVNPATLAVTGTVVLKHSERADTSVSSRGIPNYLGPAVISPDGLSAWVASKQDNIKRGQLRDGLPLTHDMTVRSIASRINLATLAEDLPSRVDFDNAGIASTAAFDPKGIYLFIALEGSREIAVTDAWGHAELARFTAGRAPQGVAVSPSGSTLYVHNFMDRTITVHDVSPVLNGTEAIPALIATLNCVTTEKLTATVLNGKQLFYDSRDSRVALQQYVSCAACHNDGGHDGRIWDFTQFGEGLRNTITLRGHGGTSQGPLHWTGNFDEVQDFEGQIRGFAGGLGLMSDTDFHAGTRSQPMGTPKAGISPDLDALAAYVASLTGNASSPQRNSDGTQTAEALAGEELFRTHNCASCHSGSQYTDSALNVFRNVGTIKPASGQRLGAPLSGLDTPTLRGLWNTAPYLHDGSAATLAASIQAHNTSVISASDAAKLAAYLAQIDDTNGPAPSHVSLTLSGPTSAVTGPFQITAAFSRSVSGVSLADFAVSGGTASNLSGSGTTYTVTITPSASTVTVRCGGNVAVDSNGNGNSASNTVTVAYNAPDLTPPSVTLGAPTSTEGAFQVIVTFTEPVTGLSSTDFTITRGLASSLTGSGASYTLTVNPSGSPVLISLPGNAAVDGAGNGNLLSNSLSVTYTPPDTMPPNVTLSTSTAAVTAAFSISVAFSESVSGLVAADFQITNGAAGTLAGSGSSYTLQITPTSPGQVTIVLPSSSASDAAGNPNSASNQLVVTYAPPASFGARINFQRSGSVIPTGYVADVGRTYRAQNGLTYGWNLDHSTLAYDRGRNPDQRLDTLIKLRSGAAWEISVPNGTYNVLASVGDAKQSSRNTLLVEGISYWNALWLPVGQFRQLSNTVTVTDGKLTITNGAAPDLATHINYVEISPNGSSIFTGGNGLNAEYFAGRAFNQLRLTRVDSAIDFDWQTTAPDVRLPSDEFSVRWRGWIVPRYTETYTFTTTSDDGVRLWIGSQILIDQWSDHSPTDHSGGVTLNAGQAYPITLEFFEGAGGAVLRLWWESASQARQIVPQEQLLLNEPGIIAEGSDYPGTWQDFAASARSNDPSSQPLDNGDADTSADLLEFALGESPGTGVRRAPALRLSWNGGAATADIERPVGISQISYQLETSSDLQHWNVVSNTGAAAGLPGGWENIKWEDAQALAGVSPHAGAIRLRVSNSTGESAASAPMAWHDESIHQGFQTIGFPYLMPEIFSGYVASAGPDVLYLDDASYLPAAADADTPYYVEFRSGSLYGHRIDLAADGIRDRELRLNLASVNNTIHSLPTDIQYSSFVLRPHVTLVDLLTKDSLTGGTSPSAADSVLFYQNGVFVTYFLLDARAASPEYYFWTKAGSSSLIDYDSLVIPPGTGCFFNRRGAATTLRWSGEVRTEAFRPLLAAGRTLLALGHPLGATPDQLGMTAANGFVGSLTPGMGSSIDLWTGDSSPTEGYLSYWLLDGGDPWRYWISAGDSSASNMNAQGIFKLGRAFFLRTNSPPQDWLVPSPVH